MKTLDGYIPRRMLADELGVCERTVYRWQLEGLPFIRVAVTPHFKREQVLEFLAERTEQDPVRRRIASQRKGG